MQREGAKSGQPCREVSNTSLGAVPGVGHLGSVGDVCGEDSFNGGLRTDQMAVSGGLNGG